jgi:hypothetical protein
LESLFAGKIAAYTLTRFGQSLLFQVVDETGQIIDLWLQSPDQIPSQEPTFLIACRDAEFAKVFANIVPKGHIEIHKPAQADVIKNLIVSFWIYSLKACKVLHRDRDGILAIGIEIERSVIRRLWYVSFVRGQT